MPVLEHYFNVKEAAKVLGVHWETVKRMCREGRIPAEKIHNMWLIDGVYLEKFASTYNEPRRGKRGTSTLLRKNDGNRHE
ncbi:MAG: helix-turn-helix domain-containing protein [Dehalococcoidales bacterium]|nr:helix-turn-helix domain-containing protein [Dehalococcoidales bacterium]